jgi:hypothetical protein
MEFLNLSTLSPSYRQIFAIPPMEEFVLPSIYINQHSYALKSLLNNKATVSPPSPSISIAFLEI